MIDWIAMAEARLASIPPIDTDKTDETLISSVLSVNSNGDGEVSCGPSAGFDGSFSDVGANVAVLAAKELAAPLRESEADSEPRALEVMPETLAQFGLERVEADLLAYAADGHDPEEINRVNNLAYHLLTIRGVPFENAMAAAAEWVANQGPHPKEKDFVDVLSLHRSMQAGAELATQGGAGPHGVATAAKEGVVEAREGIRVNSKKPKAKGSSLTTQEPLPEDASSHRRTVVELANRRPAMRYLGDDTDLGVLRAQNVALREEVENLRTDNAELIDQQQQLFDEHVAMSKIIATDDKLAQAVAEIANLQRMNRVLESRMWGLNDEKNVYIREVKSCKKQIKVLEQKLKLRQTGAMPQ